MIAGDDDAYDLTVKKEPRKLGTSTPAHDACPADKVKSLMNALEDEPELVAFENRDKRTPLHVAALHGALQCVDLLLERGAKLTVVDTDGDTPLHLASYWGHRPVVLALLKTGLPFSTGSLELRNKFGRTPLEYAAWQRHQKIVHALINSNAKCDTRSDAWPIIDAVRRGRISTEKKAYTIM